MNGTHQDARECPETVKRLTREAVKFLADKNKVSERYIATGIASLNADIINQIDQLVMSALAEMWEEF